jgi:hypothetical protein
MSDKEFSLLWPGVMSGEELTLGACVVYSSTVNAPTDVSNVT